MRIRLKFLGVSLLLCLALMGTIISATHMVLAYRMLQQKHQRVLAGDVSTVDFWMTVPYVARVYHIPATCLDHSLGIARPTLQRHATLGYLANYYKKNVVSVIHTVQKTILNYRVNPSTCAPPQTARLPDQSDFLFSRRGERRHE